MKRAAMVLALVLVASVLPAGSGRADDEALRRLTTPMSEIEVGAFFTSGNSYKFGDFTGLEEGTVRLLTDFDLRGRPGSLDDSTVYWRLTGSNVGIDSRRVRAEYGEQGIFGISLWFDQIPHYVSDSSRTPFRLEGSGDLILPPGWVAGTTTAGMTTLVGSLGDMDVDYERKEYGGRFSLHLPGPWKFVADYNRETKEGTKIMGAVIGNSGGNPRAALLPEPIDYVTHEGNVGFEYAGERLQGQVGYYVSSFHNNEDYFRWLNPYAEIAGWKAGAVGYVDGGTGTMGQAPDNLFQQVTLGGGYDLTDTTRFAANAAWGTMTQDETFLPYSGNPNLVVTTPLPRSDFNGRINTLLLQAAITSRPLPGLRLGGSYRYDDRANRSPRDTYIYIGGDSQDQPGIVSDKARLNSPYSFTAQTFELDGSYEIFHRTDVGLELERELTSRDYEEREQTSEDTIRAKVHTRPWHFLSAHLEASHANRDGDTYDGAGPYLESHTAAYLATVPLAERFENHPFLRRFHLADRKRDEIRAGLHVVPVEMLAVGFNVRQTMDDYPHSFLGIESADTLAYGVDLSFTPQEWVTGHLFYTGEDLKTKQRAWSFSGGASKIPHSTDPGRQWSTDVEDFIDTFGVGWTFDLLDGRLELGAEYVYSKSRNKLDYRLGATLAAGDVNTPYPYSVTRIHDLSLHAEYELRPDVSVRVAYLFEKFTSTDWAVDDIAQNSIDRVISTGELSPDHRAHLGTLSIVYKFW